MRAPAEASRCEAGEQERRVGGFDRLRGLAVLVMVADHALGVWAPVGGLGLRITVGRLAMPLFCLVAGALVRPGPPSRRRSVQLVVAVVVAGMALESLSLAGPLFLAGFVLMRLTVVPAVLQYWWGPMVLVTMLAQPVLFSTGPLFGYELAALALLMVLGSWYSLTLAEVGARLPRALALPGRYPLALYCGHLVAFVVLVSL